MTFSCYIYHSEPHHSSFLTPTLSSTATYIFHIVLDAVLLQVGWSLCSVKPLCGVQVGFFKVIPVDLQLVLWVRTQVHWWHRRQSCY